MWNVSKPSTEQFKVIERIEFVFSCEMVKNTYFYTQHLWCVKRKNIFPYGKALNQLRSSTLDSEKYISYSNMWFLDRRKFAYHFGAFEWIWSHIFVALTLTSIFNEYYSYSGIEFHLMKHEQCREQKCWMKKTRSFHYFTFSHLRLLT